MKKGLYATRRAAGFCVGSGACDRPVHRGGLCMHHWKARKATLAKSAPALYLERKLSGRCTRNGCKENQRPDALTCTKHGEYRSPAQISRNGSYVDKTRKRWRSEGRCGFCGHEPINRKRSKRYGTKCLDKQLARAKESREEARLAAGLPQDTRCCTNCLQPGHRAPGCPNDRHREAALEARRKRRRQRRRRLERSAAARGVTIRPQTCTMCERTGCRKDVCPRRRASCPDCHRVGCKLGTCPAATREPLPDTWTPTAEDYATARVDVLF